MGKPIDAQTRKMIFAMIRAGASTRAIVAQTGVSKSAINSLKAKCKTKDAGDPLVADHTTTESTTPRARAIKVDVTKPTTESTTPDHTDEAFAGLCNLIDPLLVGMRTSKMIKDGKERAIAETKYAEALIKVYSKLGSWQGLDNPEPPPATTSPLEKFGEAMKMYMEGEDESK